MNTDEYIQQIEEDIYKKTIDTNIGWHETDIYVISYYFWEDEQNPCKPRLSIGFNTERQYQKMLPHVGKNHHDARWNYAWWCRDDLFSQYGCDQISAELIRKWVMSYNIHYFEEEWPHYGDDTDKWNQYDVIKSTFIHILIRIVQNLHNDGLLQLHFGKEIPMIIHELEYDETSLKINVLANGNELIEKGFVDLCNGK